MGRRAIQAESTQGETGSAPMDTARPVMSPAVELSGVRREFRGRQRVVALDGIDLAIRSGSFTAVMGPSGSGKSTLLQCAAGLDRPSSGSIRLSGQDISGLSEKKLVGIRRNRIGFVFQAYTLLPALTVEQNVALPLRLDRRRAARAGLREALHEVGLDGRAHNLPAELSGGQQQRVAIARALVTRPEVVFADEPTGALDTRTADEVLGLLRRAVDAGGRTVVMVTHDPRAARWADRVVFLSDGRTVRDLPHPTAEQVEQVMRGLGAWR